MIDWNSWRNPATQTRTKQLRNGVEVRTRLVLTGKDDGAPEVVERVISRNSTELRDRLVRR